jgi:uncharacterized surface protein with fasciclin (FAS1) repeats
MADLVETMRNADSLKKFVDALQAAGVVDTLKGQGPFTVFAPANEAFAKLPKEKVDALLRDAPRLGALLTSHVVPGKITTAEAQKLDSLATLGGKRIKVGHDGSLTVNEAKVVQADVSCDNGVLHIIDTVLMPV